MSAFGFGLGFRLRRHGLRDPGFDFTGGALPPGASLTRASAAMRFDASGMLGSVAADVARFDTDPLTLAPRGLLIEPAVINLLIRSAAIDDATAWPSAAVTTTANQDVAPDGATAAERMTIGATGHFLKQSAAVTPGTAYTLSFWVRRGTAAALAVGVYDNVANSWIVTAQSYFAQTAASGYRRVTLGFTAPAGCTSAAVYPTLNGSGVGTFYLWGAQLEAGAAATTYIATGPATAARSADRLTLDWGSRGVADGVITARYTFDDGSSQDIATTVAGGAATVPTNLARPWLRRADRL